MESLVALLTRERLLAELVVFKLLEMRQLLLAGEARFLPWAAEEVERAMTSLRETELQRAVLVAQVAADRGLPDREPPLSALIEDTPEPWRTVMVEAADGLRRLCAEAAEHVEANKSLAARGANAVSDLLGRTPAAAGDGLSLYGPDATVANGVPRARVAQSL
jgi:hypothetical protein